MNTLLEASRDVYTVVCEPLRYQARSLAYADIVRVAEEALSLRQSSRCCPRDQHRISSTVDAALQWRLQRLKSCQMIAMYVA
jgi:hypothetical protein